MTGCTTASIVMCVAAYENAVYMLILSAGLMCVRMNRIVFLLIGSWIVFFLTTYTVIEFHLYISLRHIYERA